MTDLLISNIDVVFLFYGLAFIGLGVIIFSQLRGVQQSRFRVVEVLPILAWFGVMHGGHELLAMLGFEKGEPIWLQVISVSLLALSYVLLLGFGYALFNVVQEKKRGIWLPALALLFFFGLPLLIQPNSIDMWALSSRYFLGFIGAGLSAIGMQRYYHAEISRGSEIKLGTQFFGATASFALYAIVAGLIVPEQGFFPASIINEASFLSLVGVPVQVFRALAAIGLSWSFWHILNIFNIEQEAQRQRSENELRESRNTLEERVQVRTTELSHEIDRRKEVEESLRNISETLQEALLQIPENMEGIEIAHLYQSASSEPGRAGGDFYDLFEMEHDKVGIVIGDVSGKGLEAATLTSLVKHSMQAYSYQYDSPAKVMSLTNEVVCRMSAPNAFVTVFFGILDKRSGQLRYCCAGHPPGIIRSNAGETAQLKTSSPVIGVFPAFAFEDEEITMELGETLFLYTDGVIEARCQSELYGEDRLARIVGRSDEREMDLPQRIMEEVSAFCKGALTDDAAILAVTFVGSMPSQSKRAV